MNSPPGFPGWAYDIMPPWVFIGRSPPNCGSAFGEEGATLALADKAGRFQIEDRHDGEAVIRHEEVDVSVADGGLAHGLLGRRAGADPKQIGGLTQ